MPITFQVQHDLALPNFCRKLMHFKRQNLIHTVVYEGTPLTFRSGIPTPASLRGGGIGLLRLGLGGGAGLL